MFNCENTFSQFPYFVEHRVDFMSQINMIRVSFNSSMKLSETVSGYLVSPAGSPGLDLCSGSLDWLLSINS